MSARTLYRLLGVLGLLLAAWVVSVLVARQRAVAHEARSAFALLRDFSNETTDSVWITSSREVIQLRCEKTGWSVNHHRADSGVVARFWAAVQATHVAGAAEIAATNTTHHESMGVTRDSALEIQFMGRNGVVRLLVGKAGSKRGTSYVREPGNDSVYLLESDLRLRASFGAEDWRDRRILAVDTAAIHRVSIRVDGSSYELERVGRGWGVDGQSAADSAVMHVLLSELARFRAIGFLESGDSIAMRRPAGAVLAYGQAGDTLAHITFGSGPGDRWVRVPGDPSVYRLAYYRVERVAPTKHRLRGQDKMR